MSEGSLKEAIVNLRYKEIDNIIKTALNLKKKPLEILEELRVGLALVGDKYQSGEYYLSDLFIAAETMKNALEILNPLLSVDAGQTLKGSVVLGSIEGDIHDFGKMIVSSLLVAAGFNVIDLGVDVSAERFVDEAEKGDADVIGISSLLSTTQPFCQRVIDELEKRGLRNRYKVIVGGTNVTEDITRYYGVDAGVNDAVEGIKIITKWIEESDEDI